MNIEERIHQHRQRLVRCRQFQFQRTRYIPVVAQIGVGHIEVATLDIAWLITNHVLQNLAEGANTFSIRDLIDAQFLSESKLR